MIAHSQKTQKKINHKKHKANKYMDFGKPKIPLSKPNTRKEPEKLEDWNNAS